MNQQDLDTIGFIMTLSEEDFDLWLEEASNDDIDHALKIIQRMKSEYLMNKFLHNFL